MVFVQPEEAETAVVGLRPGSSYTFFWVLSSGVCGEFSRARLQVDVSITGSVTRVCQSVNEFCEDEAVALCANPIPTSYNGRWTQPEAQRTAGVDIVDSTSISTEISLTSIADSLEEYTFYWTVTDSDQQCTVTDTTRLRISGLPDATATLPVDELVSCTSGTTVAAISPPAGVNGRWSSPDASLTFASLTSAETQVFGLQTGSNRLVWSLEAGACRAFSSTELFVLYEEQPVATSDTFEVSFQQATALNVLTNDEWFAPDFTVELTDSPANGTASVNADGSITYTPNVAYVGSDAFSYELCSVTCNSDCSPARVNLMVGGDAACVVPTIITPNGDGINDQLVIPCLETDNYPNNEVQIFNQWGDEVFRAAPYQNDWRGTYQGADLPVGTYYWIVSVGPNEAPKSGFLVLER